MSTFICSCCRVSLRRAIRIQTQSITNSIHKYSSRPPRDKLADINILLSEPSWSVRSLLPDPEAPQSEEITPTKLHHLLRLSALPLPKSPEEEAEMLKILHSQLHFVKDIQKVDTGGVEPLQSIRNETKEGIKEITIGMEELKEALEKEEIKGRNRRPRRRRGVVVDAEKVEGWDVLETATETVELAGGKFFVVRSGKE